MAAPASREPPKRLPDGRLEWTVPELPKPGCNVYSGKFKQAGRTWYLCCKVDGAFLGVYLHSGGTAQASFRLMVLHHADASKSVTKERSYTYTKPQGRGWPELLPLSGASNTPEDAGFLKDGRLVVQLELLVLPAAVERQAAAEEEEPQDRPIKRLKPTPVEPKSLGGSFLSLLGDAETSDLTLKADGVAFHVHRAILKARGPFFATLFANKDFADSKSKELPLPHAKPKALKLMLRYIYGDVLGKCSRDLLKPTIELADYLQLQAARVELCVRLVEAALPSKLVQDMVWAEQRGGKWAKQLVSQLMQTFVANVEAVSEEALEALASECPKLSARCTMALVRRLPNAV